MIPLTTSIFSACGCFGNPGIRMMVPAIATIISAPALMTRSLMVILKFLGIPYALASSEKEYCVLAIHTGNLSYPRALIRSNWRLAAGFSMIPSAP